MFQPKNFDVGSLFWTSNQRKGLTYSIHIHAIIVIYVISPIQMYRGFNYAPAYFCFLILYFHYFLLLPDLEKRRRQSLISLAKILLACKLTDFEIIFNNKRLQYRLCVIEHVQTEERTTRIPYLQLLPHIIERFHWEHLHPEMQNLRSVRGWW